jgi:16S rRNA (guanine527-N7)-methyltransferase
MKQGLTPQDFERDLAAFLARFGHARAFPADGGRGVIGTDAAERIRGLAEAITRWNGSINLVSRKDIARLISYHFCDSASLIPFLRRLNDIDVLDVGGSNGLPGLVMAALMPGMRLVICDSKKRRLPFVEEVCGPGEISRKARMIPNCRFELARIDSPGFRSRYGDFFDLIVARAVARMGSLVKWCMPLLKSGGGRLVAYKGSRAIEELSQAESCIFECGATMAAVVESPWRDTCNPLRLFTIVEKGRN